MKVQGKHYRTIWTEDENSRVVEIIDQRFLPHRFVLEKLRSAEDAATAIRDMHVRGAGLIGATAGYGMFLSAINAPATSEGAFMESVEKDAELLQSTRPTAINLRWAVERVLRAMKETPSGIDRKIAAALETARVIADEDSDFCRRIGEHGLGIIERLSRKKQGDTVHILTHCNAGWLAFVDYGTATSPIYAAFDRGLKVHVWVDETRPRNQGASLTAWELGEHGVPHTVIVDNAGGHLMQKGLVDMVITGTDRTTYTGDVANKIGTYLKALAARDNDIPFYVALPSSSFDWTLSDGVGGIPIEQRNGSEVKMIQGLHAGEMKSVLLTPENSAAANYAFDVTPRRLVTGLITERGICEASEQGVFGLYPEMRSHQP